MLASSRPVLPEPARMARLVDVLDHPERSAPAIHVTGTNGKTSTSRALTALLGAKGLTVGTYTSPHLVTLNERIAVDGEPISDDDLAEVLSDLAAIEPLLDGLRPTWFELMTAAAFRYFSDRPVDVMVIEVGMGGRYDATNVVDAAVAVVTNVGLDHVEFLGPTRADIAGEKAGIVKPGATLVLGERDPSLLPIFEAEEPERLWWAGRDYEVTANRVAVGGRAVDLRTPGATYDGVWLGVHGGYQGDNFAAAVAAVEAFFDAPVEEKLLREAAGSLRSPGRLEVVSSDPLVVLDGAKNVEGAASSAAAVAEEFPGARSTVLVVGMLQGKDPAAMLSALGVGVAGGQAGAGGTGGAGGGSAAGAGAGGAGAGGAGAGGGAGAAGGAGAGAGAGGAAGAAAPPVRLVVSCPPPSPRAQSADVIADAARAAGVEAVATAGVREALEVALARAEDGDLVLVTGSLYVVGAARAALVR